MGTILFVCISFFLILFAINNDLTVMLASPLALGLVGVAVVADLYLLRSLLRDWIGRRE